MQAATQRQHKQDNKTKGMLAMKHAGLPYEEIGKQYGMSKSGAWRYLERTAPEHKEFHALKENLADQFAKLTIDNLNLSAKLTKILAEKPDEELKELNAVNVAAIKRTADVGAGIAHDHYRLESGQSTDNISVLSASIKDLQEARNRRSSTVTDQK